MARTIRPAPREAARAGGRERLLSALADHLGERGFHRVQVGELTAAAGMSTGAFYSYFADKEQILITLIDHYFDDLAAMQAAVRADFGSEMARREYGAIRALVRGILRFNLERRGQFAAWYSHGHGVAEEIDQRIAARMSAVESALAADLRSSKLLKSREPELLAQALVGMIFALSRRMIQTGRPGVDLAVRTLGQFLIGGLNAYGGNGAKPGR